MLFTTLELWIACDSSATHSRNCGPPRPCERRRGRGGESFGTSGITLEELHRGVANCKSTGNRGGRQVWVFVKAIVAKRIGGMSSRHSLAAACILASVAQFIESLVLPLKSQMERLLRGEQYLMSRRTRAAKYPAGRIIQILAADDSFPVERQSSLKDIERQATV
jgi:hypothetical protein